MQKGIIVAVLVAAMIIAAFLGGMMYGRGIVPEGNMAIAGGHIYYPGEWAPGVDRTPMSGEILVYQEKRGQSISIRYDLSAKEVENWPDPRSAIAASAMVQLASAKKNGVATPQQAFEGFGLCGVDPHHFQLVIQGDPQWDN